MYFICNNFFLILGIRYPSVNKQECPAGFIQRNYSHDGYNPNLTTLSVDKTFLFVKTIIFGLCAPIHWNKCLSSHCPVKFMLK